MLFGKKDKKSEDIVIGGEDQDPVPPYPEDTNGTPSIQTQDVKASSSSSSSPYPPQSHHTQAPSHVFLIRYTNNLWTDIAITDRMSPHETLYTAHLRWTAPHITFSKPSSPEAITNTTGGAADLATVKFHTLRANLDVLLHPTAPSPTAIDLHIKALKWKPDVTYASPALNGEKLTWKVKTYMKTIDIECRDAQGVPLARISTTRQLVANLEFYGERMFGGDGHGDGEERASKLLDELVVTGTALAQYNLMVVLQAWAASVS